jgi:hypothetical protein
VSNPTSRGLVSGRNRANFLLRFRASRLSRVSKGLAPRPVPRPLVKRERSPEVGCELEGYHGGIARCWVEVSGTKLPVAFPAEALSGLHLAEGDQFFWKVRKGAPTSADFRKKAADVFRPDESLLEALSEAIREREVGIWAQRGDS